MHCYNFKLLSEGFLYLCFAIEVGDSNLKKLPFYKAWVKSLPVNQHKSAKAIKSQQSFCTFLQILLHFKYTILNFTNIAINLSDSVLLLFQTNLCYVGLRNSIISDNSISYPFFFSSSIDCLALRQRMYNSLTKQTMR